MRRLKSKIKQHWGELTDDDLDVIAGKKDVLIGYTLQKAEKFQD